MYNIKTQLKIDFEKHKSHILSEESEYPYIIPHYLTNPKHFEKGLIIIISQYSPDVKIDSKLYGDPI